MSVNFRMRRLLMGQPMLLLLYCLERLVFVVLAPESRQFVAVEWLPKRLVWYVDAILAVRWLKVPAIDKCKMKNMNIYLSNFNKCRQQMKWVR